MLLQKVKSLVLVFSAILLSAPMFGQNIKNLEGGTWYKNDTRIARNHNVCKKLQGEVLIYAIFVDTDQSKPWTEYDRETTIDSLNKAKEWILEQAEDNDVYLKVEVSHMWATNATEGAGIRRQFASQGRKKRGRRRRGSADDKGFDLDKQMREILEKRKGVDELIKWGDNVVRATTDFENKERLIAHLRNEKYVESVVLMYMLNNYYMDDLLMNFNTMSNKEIEFCVASFKYPVQLAHEILHLFGATDLSYHNPFYATSRGKEKLAKKNKKDIMARPDKTFDELDIGPITKYLLGWTEKIDPKRAKAALNEGKIKAKGRGDYLR